MRGFTKSEEGIALFLVLWVLTLLSVIVGEFCFAMRAEVNITRNFKEQTTAYYIAVAGVSRTVGELIRDEVILRKVKQPKSEKEEEEQEGEEEQDYWRINVDIPPVPYGQGQFEVKIGNESGKVNINGANESMLKMMLKGFDLDEQDKNIIVDSIMDWRDKNNLHRINGAEDDYYRSLSEPYECKDGDFDSIEELLMVRGVTPEIFYGGLDKRVTVFKTPNKIIRLDHGSKTIRPDLNKISINAASPDVLLALPSMTDDLVKEIMDFRKEKDFISLTEISSLIGSDVYNAISPYITLEIGPYFRIMSTGKMEDGKIRQAVEAIVEIDKGLKRGHRVVQWRDSFQYQGEQPLR